jgi:hypothetical protein
MTRKTLLGTALAMSALAAAAAGCNENRADAGQTMSFSASKYCTPFRTANNTTTTAAPVAPITDPSAAFEDCVHRWAYALAPARDPADIVARAAVDACSANLSRWNQQTLDQNPQGVPEAATSLTTGQPTDLMSEHVRYAESRALFYVVQARAGNCAGPPANQMVESAPPAVTPAAAVGAPGQLAPAPASRYGAG